MKREFDTLEIFRESMDALLQLNCGTPAGSYNEAQAAAFLAKLSNDWRMGEDEVTAIVAQEARDLVFKRQRFVVWEALSRLMPYVTQEDFYRCWEKMTQAERDFLTDNIIRIYEREVIAWPEVTI